MNRKVSFAPGEYYHLYNRGNDKRKIYVDDADHERFIKLLFFCNGTKPVDFRKINKGETFAKYVEKRGETLVDIGAYCLMPNHFHLLVRAKNDGDVSHFMKKVCTAYAMYFNLKNQRTGKLFEGAFQAAHADSDEYLKYLFAYIHLNPIKLIDSAWKEKGLGNPDQAREFLERYPYSSHIDYQSSGKNHLILNRTAFPDYFSEKEGVDVYMENIQDWLTMQR